MASDAPLNIDALVAALTADPEAAKNLDLTVEDMIEVQGALNPYARIAGPRHDPRRPRVAALSFTNLREDYIRRFTMTGLVAFVWRMYEEHTVEPETRRWTRKIKGAKDPFTVAEIGERVADLNKAYDLLKAKEAAFEEAKAAAQEYNEKELVFSEAEMKAASELDEKKRAGAYEGKEAPANPVWDKMQKMDQLLKRAREAHDEYEGVRFVTTLHLRNVGLEADGRMLETERAAKEHPKSRALIQETPDRYRGILPSGQQEMPADRAKAIIRDFLAGIFEYNPDAHVRKAYDEVEVVGRKVGGVPDAVLVDPHDPDRLPLKAFLGAAPKTEVEADVAPFQAMLAAAGDDRQRDYNTICRLLEHPRLAAVARYVCAEDAADPDRQERWRRLLFPQVAKEAVPAIPPQDTFHRAEYYMEVHMEALRAATNVIYAVKPNLDVALQLMDVYEGTPEEVEKWGEKFRDTNQDKVITDIKLVPFGAWTVMADFEQNREKINFFNRHTELMERIFKRTEEDKKLGGLLMRNRITKLKAKNIREAGPDAPGLAEYKSQFPLSGAQPGISDVERKRLEKARGDVKAAQELKYYEEQEENVRRLEQEAKVRKLTTQEMRELEESLANMKKAEEMLAVPDDAIQVDAWITDGKAGTITRKPMYTKAADCMTGDEDPILVAENTRRAELAASLVKKAEEDPLRFYATKEAKELAKKAMAEGLDQPPLAPFAQDFLQRELEAEKESLEPAATGGGAAAPSERPLPDADAIDAILDAVTGTDPGQAAEPSAPPAAAPPAQAPTN